MTRNGADSSASLVETVGKGLFPWTRNKSILAIFAFTGKNGGEMTFLVPVWKKIFFEFSGAF